MKGIFDQAVLNKLTAKNRLVRSATWEGIAKKNGSINKKTYDIYEELAEGGVGTIITGFTSVAANDHYFGGMMRLCDDSLISQYRKLVKLIHTQNVSVLTQLALGAYYRTVGNRSVQVEPDDMTVDEIHLVRDQFIAAAVRAEKADFDGVQIHAAHFFFLSRFVSPAVNHRTDEYGSSTENRSRLVIEIIKGIREKAPSMHISAKINSSDFTYDGLNTEQSLAMCKLLSGAGIDSIEVSGNGTSVGGIRPHLNEAYFAPFAEKLAEEIDTPVILVGGMRSRDTMEEVLNRSKIEMISLSRPLLREPDLPNRMQRGETNVSRCVSCNACYFSLCHKCVFRRRERS